MELGRELMVEPLSRTMAWPLVSAKTVVFLPSAPTTDMPSRKIQNLACVRQKY